MDSNRPQTKTLKGRFAPKPRPPKKEEHVTPKIDKDAKSDAKTQESPVGRSSNEHQAGEGSKAPGYREPWDYETSNYPTTLPLRRPYSGDPNVLDEAEFGEAPEYDENSVSCASHLGLLEEQDEAAARMFLLQIGDKLPLGSRKGKEVDGNARAGSLEDLKEGGYMGKMLVYKSGAVKLKLGDILYDVGPGLECSFPQSVMAINTREKHCCELGTVGKMAVVTPDVDSLLQNEND